MKKKNKSISGSREKPRPAGTAPDLRSICRKAAAILFRPFRAAAEWITDHLLRKKWSRPGDRLSTDLLSLNLGDMRSLRDYYVRKTSLLLAVLAAGLLIAGAAVIASSRRSRALPDGVLQRPGYGQGGRVESLEAAIGSEEAEKADTTINVSIREQEHTKKEQRELISRSIEELASIVPGGNPSLDEVRSDLVFPERMQDGAVTVSWMTSPQGILDADGAILQAEDEEGTLVHIQAFLTCGEEESMHEFYARVFPPARSGQEQLIAALSRSVRRADERDRYRSTLTLPDEVDGTPVAWSYPRANTGLLLLLLTLLGALGLWVGLDERVHGRALERRQQLTLDYPELLWKLVMLLGAGLTIHGAFSRIDRQYGSSPRRRYLYEEIHVLCYEMQSGISEGQAYERFGRRCKNPEYIRLGSYLSQNLKKGTRGLQEFLLREASDAEEMRRNQAVKMGEQAGTKLLFPLVLMLSVVLAVLMVPAFISF